MPSADLPAFDKRPTARIHGTDITPGPRAVPLRFRVRFQETDLMGIVWHGNYFSWFESGRVEYLRRTGMTYNDLRAIGLNFAVIHSQCDYKKPAKYDEVVTLWTDIERVTPTRIEHSYLLFREEELLAIGRTVVVAVDNQGRPCRIPDAMIEGCRIKEPAGINSPLSN